jgi:hypothetical protein
VDLDGATVYSTVFDTAVETLTPDPSWQCLPVGGPGEYQSIIDLASGTQLADLSGMEVVSVVDDGCTVLGRRGGVLEIVSRDGVVVVGDHAAAVLSPDGRAVATIAEDGSVHLARLDGLELGTPTDLTPVSGNNSIVTFVAD